MSSVTRWSAEEDDRLREKMLEQEPRNAQEPINWHHVASDIPGRSNKDCRKRWCNVVKGQLDGSIRKGPWRDDEDQRLKHAVQTHGASWVRVAECVPGRTPDQCSKRWQHALDPSLDRSEWTEEANQRLLKAVQRSGRTWVGIRNDHFPGRSSNDVKNQYTILTRRLSRSDAPRTDAYGDSERTEAAGSGLAGQVSGHSSPSPANTNPATPSLSASYPSSTYDRRPPSPPVGIVPVMTQSSGPAPGPSIGNLFLDPQGLANPPGLGAMQMECDDMDLSNIGMGSLLTPTSTLPPYPPSESSTPSWPWPVNGVHEAQASIDAPESQSMEAPARSETQTPIQISIKTASSEAVKEVMNVLVSFRGKLSFEVKRDI